MVRTTGLGPALPGSRLVPGWGFPAVSLGHSAEALLATMCEVHLRTYASSLGSISHLEPTLRAMFTFPALWSGGGRAQKESTP